VCADRDVLEIGPSDAGPFARTAADRAMEAILRTYATATQHGYRIHAVGVPTQAPLTWFFSLSR
jgi:hypothetical protein